MIWIATLPMLGFLLGYLVARLCDIAERKAGMK